jgi:hypothetical protein
VHKSSEPELTGPWKKPFDTNARKSSFPTSKTFSNTRFPRLLKNRQGQSWKKEGNFGAGVSTLIYMVEQPNDLCSLSSHFIYILFFTEYGFRCCSHYEHDKEKNSSEKFNNELARK